MTTTRLRHGAALLREQLSALGVETTIEECRDLLIAARLDQLGVRVDSLRDPI